MAIRKREEGEEINVGVSEIDSVMEKATVHGALSPVKVSRKNSQCKYFHGSVSDGKEELRLVSFAPELRPDLEKFQVEGSPVALVNCQVKKTPTEYVLGGEEYELVASTRLRVRQLPEKNFGTVVVKPFCSCYSNLDKLDDFAVNERITVLVKVLEICAGE